MLVLEWPFHIVQLMFHKNSIPDCQVEKPSEAKTVPKKSNILKFEAVSLVSFILIPTTPIGLVRVPESTPRGQQAGPVLAGARPRWNPEPGLPRTAARGLRGRQPTPGPGAWGRATASLAHPGKLRRGSGFSRDSFTYSPESGSKAFPAGRGR